MIGRLISLAVVLSHELVAGYIYSYTGNSFVQVSGTGGPSTSDSIRASFEIAALLPANLTTWNTGQLNWPLSWSITNGVHHVTNADPDFTILTGFSTDSAGAIVAWQVQVFDTQRKLLISTVRPSYACCPGPYDQSFVWANGQAFPATAGAVVSGSPGAWALTSTVPEPSGAALILCALLLLIAGKNLRQPTVS